MTRVIKVGGRVQDDPALIDALVPIARAGGVLVHGGGDGISALQRKLGFEPRFVGGRRVTTADELDVVRMVLSGTANKHLVARLAAAGVRAVGVSGEDGGVLAARVAAGAPLGRVGEEVSAHTALLADLLHAGWFPVVSPLARDADAPDGAGLNVNGDDAAAAIAVALGASELVFVADVAGVLVDGVALPTLASDDADALVRDGVAAGGMAAKLQAGFRALAGGVRCVRIADVSALDDSTRGTTLLSPTNAPWPQ